MRTSESVHLVSEMRGRPLSFFFSAFELPVRPLISWWSLEATYTVALSSPGRGHSSISISIPNSTGFYQTVHYSHQDLLQICSLGQPFLEAVGLLSKLYAFTFSMP